MSINKTGLRIALLIMLSIGLILQISALDVKKRLSVSNISDEVNEKWFYYKIYKDGADITKDPHVLIGNLPLYKFPRGSFAVLDDLKKGRYFIIGFVDINGNVNVSSNNINYDQSDLVLKNYKMEILEGETEIIIPLEMFSK